MLGSRRVIHLSINGRRYAASVEPRRLLADFIREDAGLPGTHVGCEHGVCGACTVLLDGRTVRSCLTFAFQAEGREVWTVEGLAEDGALSPLQTAFWDHQGLQCGFCTPGMLMTAVELLADTPNPTEQEIRAAISGNLCRCTGYQSIVESIAAAAEHHRAGELEPMLARTRPVSDRQPDGSASRPTPSPDHPTPSPDR